MSKYILTAPVLALAATASPAQAQDVSWAGFYIGAHGALVDTQSDWSGESIFQTIDGGEGGFTTTQSTVPIVADLSGSEIGGGGRIGFNFQAGSVVFGAEADATFFGRTESMTSTQAGTTYTLTSHASDLQTVRARAGLAFGRAMIFATGGFAFGGVDHTLSATNVSEVLIDGGEGGTTVGTEMANLFATGETEDGWAIGGGGEVMVTDNLSATLTVLHVDLGSTDLADADAPSSVAATVDSSMLIGTVGLNLRF